MAPVTTGMAFLTGLFTALHIFGGGEQDSPLSVEDLRWSAWKATYNKTYADPSEEAMRRALFDSNAELVAAHNELGASFSIALNDNADITRQEISKYRKGLMYVPPSLQSTGPLFYSAENYGDLPKEVDWRKKGHVTPIKDQGQCGSCWAFSSTGALEAKHMREKGHLVSLSEGNLVDCTRNKKYGNHGCSGGLMDKAFDYVHDNHGIDTEASYPYTAMEDNCTFKSDNVGAYDGGHLDIKHGSEADLEHAVATVGPVAVAIDASSILFQLYRSGVYSNPLCSSKDLDHGVLVIGYGEDKDSVSGKTTKYWLVKNSWGTGWGDKGYIKMAKGEDNMCGIASMASLPKPGK